MIGCPRSGERIPSFVLTCAKEIKYLHRPLPGTSIVGTQVLY